MDYISIFTVLSNVLINKRTVQWNPALTRALIASYVGKKATVSVNVEISPHGIHCIVQQELETSLKFYLWWQMKIAFPVLPFDTIENADLHSLIKRNCLSYQRVLPQREMQLSHQDRGGIAALLALWSFQYNASFAKRTNTNRRLEHEKSYLVAQSSEQMAIYGIVH